MTEFKEVLFDEFCKTCKYEPLHENKEPCCKCLGIPMRLNSHKPVKWEKKEK